jgi:hypothetical protein
MSQKVTEKIKTRILLVCPTNFIFFFEIRAVYEKMWKNIIQPDRSQMTIWRMRIASCIPKATKTHSEYVIPIVFLVLQSASMLRTYIACLG